MATKKASPQSLVKAEAKADLIAAKRLRKLESLNRQIEGQLFTIEACVGRIRWLREEKANLQPLLAPVSMHLH